MGNPAAIASDPFHVEKNMRSELDTSAVSRKLDQRFGQGGLARAEKLEETHVRLSEASRQDQFCHSIRGLAQSEARPLARSVSADRIRRRVVAASRSRNFAGYNRSAEARKTER